MLNYLAQNTINLKNVGTEWANLSNLSFPDIISSLLKLILVIASLVFFFMLVIGGIKWIASGGDKSQTEAARNQITAALVGLVIVFAAWAIVQLISVFFGVNILSLNISFLGGP